MSSFWLEVLVIFLLVLANGFFSASEIAIISTRRTRVAELARKVGLRARWIQALQENPEGFFATVQIGVTLVATLASALAGAMAIEYLKPLLSGIPLFARSSEAVAIGLVVVVVTLVTLLLGELLPKSLAARYSEGIAVRVAPWLGGFSRVLSPVVHALSGVTRWMLRLLGTDGPQRPVPISEEEVKLIVREGRDLGIFDATESELIHKVFEFADKSIRKILIPRPRIRALRLSAAPEEILRVITENGYMRYPVYGRSLDDIRGILYAKDLFRLVQSGLIGGLPPPGATATEGGRVDLSKLLHPAHFVPETIKVSQLLKDLQKRRIPMAIVLNEFGSVEGLVTVEDLLEEIVGEIGRDGTPEEHPVQSLEEGAFLLDASLPVRDLRDTYGFAIPEGEDYQTLAGLLMQALQKIPRPGETWTYDGLRFTVVDMDGRRISKVRVEREGKLPPSAPHRTP